MIDICEIMSMSDKDFSTFFDKNGDGKLTLDEFNKGCQELIAQKKMKNEEQKTVDGKTSAIDQLDKLAKTSLDKDGNIDIIKFKNMYDRILGQMQKYMVLTDPEGDGEWDGDEYDDSGYWTDEDPTLLEILDADNDGIVEVCELMKIDDEQFSKYFDQNNDGQVSLEEFKQGVNLLVEENGSDNPTFKTASGPTT
eukprot:UN29493